MTLIEKIKQMFCSPEPCKVCGKEHCECKDGEECECGNEECHCHNTAQKPQTPAEPVLENPEVAGDVETTEPNA